MSSQWFLEYFEKSMLEKIIEKNPNTLKKKDGLVLWKTDLYQKDK